MGKLHMGNLDASPRPGFDTWLSFKGQGRYGNPLLNRDGESLEKEGYLTDILSKEASDFIKAKRSKPFSLCLWHKAVHDPTTPAERHKTAYADERIARRPNVLDKPDGGRGGPAEEKIRNQMRCLLAVDEGLGQIFEALQSTGQLDNTVVVFSSDNGYFWGEHRLGDKRRAYEEGLRIPLLIRYPRLIAAGLRPASIVANIDLAPTFLKLAGTPVPANMQGASLLPLFGKETPHWRTKLLTEYFSDPGYPHQPWQSIRTERWKYVHYTAQSDADELFDLKTDPYEMKNLVGDPASAAPLARLRLDLASELKRTS